MEFTSNLEKGTSGEDIALKFLMDKGFRLVTRNVRYKWGEIDLIVQKGLKIHFIEVKSRYVIRETQANYVNPEDNMTFHKMKKTLRSVETYLSDIGGQESCDWQIDLISVILIKDKAPIIELYENIVM